MNALTAVYCKYRFRAYKKDIDFRLTRDEAVALFKGDCAYCGAPPASVVKHNHHVAPYNGIDRVDSAKGYVHGNVVTSCQACNYAKRLMTRDQFIAWARRVVTFNRTDV